MSGPRKSDICASASFAAPLNVRGCAQPCRTCCPNRRRPVAQSIATGRSGFPLIATGIVTRPSYSVEVATVGLGRMASFVVVACGEMTGAAAGVVNKSHAKRTMMIARATTSTFADLALIVMFDVDQVFLSCSYKKYEYRMSPMAMMMSGTRMIQSAYAVTKTLRMIMMPRICNSVPPSSCVFCHT